VFLDPWHFDTDPGIRTSEKRIRIRLFSSMTFRTPTKNNFFPNYFWSSFFDGIFTSFYKAVFRIHDILMFIWNRIRGSMPLSNGSGSWFRILLFSVLTSKCQQKTIFSTQFFQLVTFWRYIYIIFQRYKVKMSHKIVGSKVFLIIFAWWQKYPDPEPDPYLWLVDPDPGGQKTRGSGGSGTLLQR
jgi:hypothetical protein